MARPICGLVVMLMVVAACGGDGDTVNTGVPAETTAATGGAEVSDVVPIDTAPCDLLTADEVAAATGLAVEEVSDEPPIDCVFDLGADAGVDIVVMIEDGQGRLGGPANLFKEYLALAADGEAEIIADVGERAVCCPFRTIAVDAGRGRFIAVGVNGGYNELAEPLEALISLARSALDGL